MPKDPAPEQPDPLRKIMADLNKEKCPACGGTGRKRNLEKSHNRNYGDTGEVCPLCGGSGSKATVRAKLIKPVRTTPHKSR
jgi:RecJ-like exonuclease